MIHEPAHVYTFVTVLDVEGPSETDAREILETTLSATLDAPENMDAEYAVLSYAVLSPAVTIDVPDDLAEALVDEGGQEADEAVMAGDHDDA
jgi:hypothetical protein